MKIDNRKDGVVNFGKYTVTDLVEKYGSPLYLYDEVTLRERCKEIKNLCSLDNFYVRYSAKANTSIALLQIIREEGILVDAMSTGEISLEMKAGYAAEDILFVSNNVSEATFREIIRLGVKVCLDSTMQLETYCSMNPGSEVCLRLNIGSGDGHHAKTVTAGKVKFGIEPSLLECAHEIAAKYNVKITGLMVHIGSLFLKSNTFHKTAMQLLEYAVAYPDINFVDFGGGFGIPYHREKEKKFPMKEYGVEFTAMLENWMVEHGRKVDFYIEPGRFIVGECGICITQVHSVKINSGIKFIGTDLGTNLLIRPELYGSYHEIVNASREEGPLEKVTVVGNICESGDVLVKDIMLPEISKDDLLIVRDTGAYGYSMASNYNSLPRPTELLLQKDGEIKVIRHKESYDDLARNQVI